MGVIVKNPKGRLVEVSEEAAEYLLSDKPTKTITGKELVDDKGKPVVILKGEHEKGYTEPSKEELKEFKSETSKKEADVSKKEADEAKKKADEEAKKAAEAEKEAEAKKEKADAKAKKAAGSPTPDN